MIKYNKIGRIAEVQVHGKELVCLYCKKNDCVHVRKWRNFWRT